MRSSRHPRGPLRLGAVGVGLIAMWVGWAHGQTPSANKTGEGPGNLLGGVSFTAGKEPISIAANTLEFDYQGRVLTYRGQVKASQGDMQLESDSLTVSLGNGGTASLKEVVAKGSVRLAKGSRWATAGEAVFDQPSQTATLSRNPVLHDGANQVSGDRVVLYLKDERFVVEGGTEARVQMKIFPTRGPESTPSPSSGP